MLCSHSEESGIYSKYNWKPAEGLKEGYELSFPLDILKDGCVENKYRKILKVGSVKPFSSNNSNSGVREHHGLSRGFQ